MSQDRQLEVCAASLASCLAAEQGGAARVELCASLETGGVTPSPGMIALARQRLSIGLHVIVRPRGGDFLYSADEFEVMRRDVLACRDLGVDGVVLGLLDADGAVDVERTRELVRLAGPMTTTFHRAFDLARDPEQALEQVIASGCRRLLTSGQAPTALDGAVLIAGLRRQAGERLILMPGGGLRPDNLAALARATGCAEFHASASAAVASAMRHRRSGVSMGAGGDEYGWRETSAATVRAMREVLRALD
ncbi:MULTISPECIES: copper homeostasis protein CutC [unclassified Chromobacterium]|uniref:copper homeostasis protein CutC n=1 Tax=unclassified Chromobacterium TaxID=2641838 RepID=UPI000653115B|nr:copper homeostasis protein CutC [Chromobacterium sp. LK1]KMN32265.1 copper homeostasis protein CutC [Chromobacterium sp. LK1]